jgi:enoyl-CoA hydratase/carnithine racemase
MSEATILVERRGPALILRIDRPSRMNSLSRDTVREFARIGHELIGDNSIRAVVITGTGDKAFCAGADLKERQTMSDDAIREQIEAYRTELGWIDASPRPVVAAINGVALGGGLELALMCDLRVCAEHAELGLPETRLGVIPGAGGTQRLPRMVGEGRAKELILLGNRVSARDALAIGLVNRVTPAGQNVVDDALSFIEPILEGAPIAIRAALLAIDTAFEHQLEVGLVLEKELYEETLKSEDRREALRALTEKRKPVFTGK